jgi:hypothetical protein
VELLYAGHHRVIAIEDNLMIIFIDDLFYQTIIDKDLCCRIWFPFHPDLNPPSVPMKVGAFAGIMEKTVAGINMHLFIDPYFH